MASISFLRVSANKEEKYLIFDKEFTKRNKSNNFTPADWDAFKVQAEKRAMIDLLELCYEYVHSFFLFKSRFNFSKRHSSSQMQISMKEIRNNFINPFTHNVVKWVNIL